MPEYIPAPYNFAPVWEKVFFYHDAEPTQAGEPEKVPSQDSPLEQGLCGYLDVTFKATTPVYVRSAGKHDAKAIRKALNRVKGDVANLSEDERGLLQMWGGFYQLPDGREALPATTVKGMVRNVLEIATFSKMTAVQNDRYGVRDLKSGDGTIYKDWMTETTTSPDGGAAFRPRTCAAWLLQQGDEWFLQPCEYGRVEHSVLSLLAQSGNESPWTKEVYGNGQSEGIPQTQSRDMYQAWAANVHHRGLVADRESSICINATLTTEAPHLSRNAPGKLLFRKADVMNFATPGTHRLVFTGRPSAAKHREFLFKAFNPGAILHRVPDGREMSGGGTEPDVRGDFEFIHQDSADWKHFWKKKIAAGEPVPVFYLAYDEPPTPGAPTVEFNGSNQLHSIGLSQMYRLAYRHRVRELLPGDHKRPEMDIAQAIFGTVSKGGSCLRGRVQCEPFPVTLKVTCDFGAIRVLNAPKPTYFPNYVEQFTIANGTKLRDRTYNTFHTPPPQGRLRGWKRYPVRKDFSITEPTPSPPPNENYSVTTVFKPLAAGTTFQGRIHFHNLLPWELGALLWALRFGWRKSLGESPFRHSVGMAKPLGCGGLQLTSLEVHAVPVRIDAVVNTQGELMLAFEDKVKTWLAASAVGGTPPNELTMVEPVLQMLSMASQEELRDPALLAYPRFPNNPRDDVKMFGEYKARDLVLPRYNQLPRSAGSQNEPI